MGVNLPELQFTSLDDIPKRVSITRQAFLDHKTRDVEFRIVQLRKLYWAQVPRILLLVYVGDS